MKKSLLLIFSLIPLVAQAQRSSGGSHIKPLSSTSPGHITYFDCSNPATYHTDQDGSYQCGYINQASVPNGGPPKTSGGVAYAGSPQNYDCYYFATNGVSGTTGSFYNSATDTATYPTNCQFYVAAPINTGLIFLILSGVCAGLYSIYKSVIEKKSETV